ncbi:1-(5-phosphoribosyl)-5-[(5-phosphoribosylamino)methylideneamino]imidazole-4-carboxamide isomerase [Pontibaca salina]|uniref:1-(5-phosphoribosyl)-5-[(5-phosphoribosylamino)methylideneamino] imidazole-4-carboxamide isomerase n=1 Tax=Pontibaca salina TaxID=2795731 RepID=A0A934M412_9RHOB|nr:1-(5-phosphoribosyl)-5-[(5-phosphoribosylamino)methylideneamino] imidazole-4-carboxamide isomerase [Pontibaca salina]MBI6630419.1 1-(5-phosphoribosyl)-5-[(5-phosphoribosylamino)methylideneamino] imidazole-4-carboxamide isomerase [Pontibaca salina]
MQLYPTIQLRQGRCVTLTRGRLEKPTVYDVDPVEMACSFAMAGAEWMHLTDLDAVARQGDNADLIEQIIRSAGIPVQLGGGFRSREVVEHWLEKGAGSIVIGSWAKWEPQAVRDLVKFHPAQIALALDVWQGQVMVDGWRKASAFTPEGFIEGFDDLPLAGIIVTDIDSDIGEIDAQLGIISGLAAKARAPVIASGVIRSLDDVARLKYVHNIAGAIIGRALLDGSVTLAEALEVARPEAEPIAEFQ